MGRCLYSHIGHYAIIDRKKYNKQQLYTKMHDWQVRRNDFDESEWASPEKVDEWGGGESDTFSFRTSNIFNIYI